MKTSRKLYMTLLSLFIASFQLEAATYTVTVATGTGAGSLKWAIDQANANAGTDNIVFATTLAGPIETDVLPDITGPVNIDGSSWSSANSGNKLIVQLSLGGPGAYSSNLRFETGSDGSSLSNLAIVGGPNAGTSVYVHANNVSVANNFFQLSGDGNTNVSVGGGGTYPSSNIYIADVSGASITNNLMAKTFAGTFSDFIYATNADNAVVTGNKFGFFANGNNMPVTDAVAISFNNGSDGATISNNVIGNTTNTGIVVDNSINATLDGNIIGFKADGITSAPITTSVSHGIYLNVSSGSSITNNIVGNINNNGVALSNSSNLMVSGNRLGVSLNGTCAPNGWSGLSFTTVSNSTISNNIIRCNTNENIYSASSTTISITGNTISSSTGPGISLNGGNSGFTITGNTISGNGTDGSGAGVTIQGSDNLIQITSNSISCNGGSSNDGIVLNGGNAGITAPSGFTYGANTTSGTGTSGYTIHLYRSTTNTGTACADCEGQTLIGTTVVSAGGTWTITHNLNLTGGNEFAVTATQSIGGRTSAYGGCQSPPLPVTLLHFSGKKNNDSILLFWTTTNETNNAGYVIEKSENGLHFDSIGFVNGNFNMINSYSFQDKELKSNICYYRLKQLDNNGQFSYSTTISISELVNMDNNIYPNPSPDGKGILKLFLDPLFDTKIEIYTYYGLFIQSEVLLPGDTTKEHLLDLSIKGHYLIKVINGNSISIIPFIII